jgi:hypothetical protein
MMDAVEKISSYRVCNCSVYGRATQKHVQWMEHNSEFGPRHSKGRPKDNGSKMAKSMRFMSLARATPTA